MRRSIKTNINEEILILNNTSSNIPTGLISVGYKQPASLAAAVLSVLATASNRPS